MILNYSIIIPHCNIPHLLQRCIDSIPVRDDLEIIVVDDNSNPEIVDFDNFPGKNRTDVITIFDKKGGGAGYARNVGVSKARGQWLLFADADDFFNYCLNDALDEYIDYECDIVYFKSSSLDSFSYTNSNRGGIKNKLIDLWEKNPQLASLNLRYLPAEPWGKLIKRSLVLSNSICFDETSAANDLYFSYMTGFYANRISVDMRAIYCVTYREGSISTVLDAKKERERLLVYARRDLFCRKNKINLIKNRTTGFTILAKTLVYRPAIFKEFYNDLLDVGFSNRIILFSLFREYFYKVYSVLLQRLK